MFNADEITAVMMGLMLLRELGSTSRLAIESATAKIERVLPAELRERTDALRGSLVLDDAEPGARTISSEWLTAFSVAAHEGKCLTITYVSAEGEPTQRLIAPYGLVLHARTWYVPAFCYLREDMRVFRVDRVRTVSRSTQSFTKPETFDARKFVLDSLARIPGTYAFEVILHAPLLTVQDLIPPTMAILEGEGNNAENTLMRCYSDDPHWMARQLARLELSFTVRQTDELREAIRTLAGDLLAGISKG
jgi:predicted DNA-binding transcriptional regulator YafY